MTLWAFLSDVHGRNDRLKRVLAERAAQAATRLVALGDIGGTAGLNLLEEAGVVCVFGNWEASGLRGLPSPYRGRVARWPAQLHADSFWAAHASPVWPEGLTITGVVDYLRERELHWTALFPSLQRTESARWAALAELETAAVTLFFHGHTHTQEAWSWIPGGVPERVIGIEFTVTPDRRWLVGVGSVGDPHDGEGACYTLYDDDARRVFWRRM